MIDGREADGRTLAYIQGFELNSFLKQWPKKFSEKVHVFQSAEYFDTICYEINTWEPDLENP